VIVPRLLARSSLTAWACVPVELFSLQAVVAGYVVSIAASDLLAKRTTSLLGKRPDGSISTIRYAIFLPYHIGLTTKLRLERSGEDAREIVADGAHRTGNYEDPFNKIVDGLYLGGWPANERLLPPRGKSGIAICDVTCELPRRAMSADMYCMVPCWDSHAPSPNAIDTAVHWVLGRLEEEYSVLIHCAHGHGRSAVVTGGVLRALGLAATVVDAGEIMKKARPLVKMNSRQLEALADWERQHYGYEVGGLHVRAGGTPGADGLRQQQEADVIGSKKGI
jgi:hypothetical protein